MNDVAIYHANVQHSDHQEVQVFHQVFAKLSGNLVVWTRVTVSQDLQYSLPLDKLKEKQCFHGIASDRKHAISHREEGRMFLNNPFSREIWRRFSHHSILSCLLCWHLRDDLAIFSHILYDPKTQQHVALFYHTDQDIQYRSIHCNESKKGFSRNIVVQCRTYSTISCHGLCSKYSYLSLWTAWKLLY
jgi:hypothetical protein